MENEYHKEFSLACLAKCTTWNLEIVDETPKFES